MQAIILAAGMGRRLGELTKENTKCMVPVNGVRLIDRLLRQLSTLPLTRIIIVIGYKGKELKEYIQSTFHIPHSTSTLSKTPSTTRPTTSTRSRWSRISSSRTIPS